MDVYDVKEFIDKQDCIIANLQSFIRELFYPQRQADHMVSLAIDLIVNQIRSTSHMKGPDGEQWPSWEKEAVEKEIQMLKAIVQGAKP